MKEAKGRDEATIDAVAKSLARFEESTGRKEFRRFHREQAVAFKRRLGDAVNARTRERLSKGTMLSTLRDLRAFFFWLAHLPGFKSHIAYADADYFNLSDKDVAVARARRDKAVPTLDQVEHVLSLMPADTIVQRRDRALIAFTMLTGTRVSANTGDIEDEVKNAGAVGVFDKNDVDGEGNYYDQALVWLGKQWDMMEVLAAARRAMEGSAADIFLLRIWPRWKMFADLQTENRTELEKIVTRQYVSHMADLLGLDDPENVSWHPFENYMSPALMSSRAHTGDIFRFDGVLWAVLTPQCDMATQKVENAVLVKCVPGIEEWDASLAVFKAAASKTTIKESKRVLEKYLNQNLPASKHFLPPLPGDVQPLLVNFSTIMTKPLDELNGRLEERVASISTPFLANIVQRFGAYISRTGQPNIDVARL